MPKKETLSVIGISQPPPGSSLDFPSERFPEMLLREALCCKIGGEYANPMHCLQYGGVVGVNSTDNCGFKRFRPSTDDSGFDSRFSKRLKVVPSKNSTTFKTRVW